MLYLLEKIEKFKEEIMDELLIPYFFFECVGFSTCKARENGWKARPSNQPSLKNL